MTVNILGRHVTDEEDDDVLLSCFIFDNILGRQAGQYVAGVLYPVNRFDKDVYSGDGGGCVCWLLC